MVVVTLNPTGQYVLDTLEHDLTFGVVVEPHFMLEGGYEALHHGIVQEAPDPRAVADPMNHQLL
jgi:hypothetical protein